MNNLDIKPTYCDHGLNVLGEWRFGPTHSSESGHAMHIRDLGNYFCTRCPSH
jgi:hypothetical protein